MEQELNRLRRFALQKASAYGGEGRGVVFLGGRKLAPDLFFSLSFLRKFNQNIPVTVFYYGEADNPEPLIGNQFCVRFEDFKADFENLPERMLRHHFWSLKSRALTFAPYNEVLFLDADCAPLGDVGLLFSSETYLNNGYVIWKDKETANVSKRRGMGDIFSALGLETPIEVESGQILVNRSIVAKQIDNFDYLNKRWPFFYNKFYGDKDLLSLAWGLAGEVKLNPYFPYVIEGFIQRHPDSGDPFFWHRSGKFKIKKNYFFSREIYKYVDKRMVRRVLSEMQNKNLIQEFGEIS